MAKFRRKHQCGASSNYVTRKAALKKLQLSLKDFRRLCILKGIHPHEPRHKKKVNKGSSEIKTWYYARDIKFLQHEPIIQKFRDYKIFLRKLKRAKERQEQDVADKIFNARPTYKLDHIVKERYPTFIDAIRDLEDGLCLIFLFSRLPRSQRFPTDTLVMCRRLSIEFLHYVIESKALRKAFISIKGIYYQAEIMGQTVNWIVPHELGFSQVTEVDFQVMSTFVEFYTAAIRFVNFRLFREIGLQYPPKIGQSKADDHTMYYGDRESIDERLYSLSENLRKEAGSVSNAMDNVEPVLDTFPDQETDHVMSEMEKKTEERKKIIRLFEKCKFFLGREVPRESLTFVIRSCGGSVSWDPTVAYGATFDESDQSITHQIIDRPTVSGTQFVSRLYVQPQWVYDCLNAKSLLSTENYLPGATLPPHLSPFVAESTVDYIPPEKIALLEQEGYDVSNFVTVSKNETTTGQEENKPKKTKLKGKPEKSMVRSGQQAKKQNAQQAKGEKAENLKMREMMIPKKQRRVYQKIIKKKKHVDKQAKNLKEKREQLDKTKMKA